ncbi:hypothetical protein D3C87_1481810 [compost metagenome]
MKHSNDNELDMRIDSFLTRKHQEYPELALRDTDKINEPVERVIAEKFFHSLTSIKFQLSR